MIGRRKKQPPMQRTPQLNQAKQSVFQYSSNRAPAEQLRARGENAEYNDSVEKVSRAAKWPYFVAAISLFVISILLSLLPGEPKVVLVNNTKPIRDNAGYSQTAAEVTGSNLLNRSKITLNRQKIAEELQQKYPELMNITVTTPLFARSAIVSAETASPIAVLRTGDAEYLVDSRGLALFDLKKISSAIKSDNLTVLIDNSETPLKTGQPALTTVQTMYVMELKHQSSTTALDLEALELAAGGGELYARYAGLPYIIKFNVYEDARKSFGTFMAAKEAAERGKTPKPAEYIDVRLPERAYIK